MTEYRLSMRKAHGEKGTFFDVLAKVYRSGKLTKRRFHSLNFAIHNTHRWVQAID